MTSKNKNNDMTDLKQLENKVDALSSQVKILVDSQKMLASLYEDMVPIMTSAMSTGSAQLADLEERGYFDFARESMHVLDAVVGAYTPDDVHALAENVVHILDLVRSVTQPEVLDFAEQAAAAAEGAGEKSPQSVISILRATAKDDDVKRGLAMGLEALRQIGKRANAAAHLDLGDHHMTALLGPKRNLKQKRSAPVPRASAPRASRAAPAPRASAPAPRATPQAAPAPAAAPAAQVNEALGVVFDNQGFMQDPTDWNKELGTSLAEALGVGELNEHHWKVLNFAREEFEKKGSSPNIRRITTGAGVPTKDLYSLFPRAPAKTVAKIAGIPKPVGCI